MSQSSESSGKILIEDYLYQADRFRFTTAPIALPLPVTRVSTSLPDVFSQRLQDLMPQIRTKIDIVIRDSYTVRIVDVHKRNYPDPIDNKPTLLIEVHNGSETSAQWSNLIGSIQDVLRYGNLNFVDVEIIDFSRAFTPGIFPQDAATGSIKLYESVRDKIAQLLLKELGQYWRCLSLFRVGKTRDKSVPSIVVHVGQFAICDWRLLNFTIRSIISPKLPPGKELGIEFILGRISHVTGDDQSFKGLLDQYPSSLKMGASIGTYGGDISGSLGGFVNLKVGGRLHRGFLTNHHVIIPQESGQLKNSFKYLSDGNPRPVVQVPSLEDLNATRAQAVNRIEVARETAENCAEKQAQRREAGARELPNLEIVRQEQLKIMQNRQRQLADFDRRYPVKLECPLVSSGNAINSNLAIIDWAFVEFSRELESSLGPNFPLLNRLPQDEPKLNTMGERMFSLPPIAGNFGEMQKDNWYYKRGRTTGITVGKCNGTETEINRVGGYPRYTKDGETYKLGQSTTRELVIIGCDDSDSGQVIQSGFSHPGDSGSFVIDQQGFVCGLLYGEFTGLCGTRNDLGVGLVTSMTDIQASVAFRTGFEDSSGHRFAGELILPKPTASHES